MSGKDWYERERNAPGSMRFGSTHVRVLDADLGTSPGAPNLGGRVEQTVLEEPETGRLRAKRQMDDLIQHQQQAFRAGNRAQASLHHGELLLA